MLLDARFRRLVMFSTFTAAVALAGCSGQPVGPCHVLYVGSAGTIFGTQVSPTSGTTGVPASTQTIVLNLGTSYPIVVRTVGGAST